MDLGSVVDKSDEQIGILKYEYKGVFKAMGNLRQPKSSINSE